ncbi:MAG: acetate/propionate family kinase [Bacillota bacterium]|uniref:Acetate kinase n=1 Tax=Thermanaerosceptrum fracticalcis TaxID=1712410 RepID=A0A7G6E578_THEFR|nr:acetate kinase [Thermanaerosceptrum fracticalcis]QNB47232.1 acetate/propionate family kinase [Thermanaerosceptrum fracticalcis]
MKVLVLNCGSSSLKYQLFDMENEHVLAKGLVERIGLPGAVLTHRPGSEKYVIETEIPNHQKAIELVLQALVSNKHGVLKSLDEISAVGHRVVHGGEDFSGSVLITDAVIDALRRNIELAPLHNPPNIMGIEACQNLMPNVPQAGVFDTAFHQTMPPQAYLYGIPYEYYQKYKIRKYGFHGTSHKYVSQRAAAMLKRPIEEVKIITCHLGNGASIAAVDRGKSIDTSMGFTPLEGLMMGTRSGDLDPAIVSFLMEKEKWTTEETSNFLNKRCGVLGLSGVSSDFRDIENAADQGHERAQLALERFAYMVKKYIGSYAAVLNGVDAIVFTAGLGENSALMRVKICEGLDYLGVKLDLDKNYTRGIEADVSADDAKTRVFVIPTNEELMIARDTYEICRDLK